MSSYSWDTVERTVRTIVQAVVGAVLAVVVGSGGWDAISWDVVWKTGAFAGLVAVLMALAGKSAGSPDDASFIDKGGD